MGENIREVVAQVAALVAEQASLAARLVALVAAEDRLTNTNGSRPEELISPDAAAALLGVSRRKVLSLARRADWRPLIVRLNRKTLRIDKAALMRWLESRRSDACT